MVNKSHAEDRPIFPEDSVLWRIAREQVLLLGGPAAAILQIAHPEVALGVARHSNFRRDSLTRLHNTLEAVYTVTFAPQTEVEAMAAQVRRVHTQVRGETPQPYSAFSPDAQMWVLATLMHTSIALTERFVSPVRAADRESYYQDMRVFGTYFGLAADFGPQSWIDFTRYYDAMLRDDRLGSLPVSRELARHVAWPVRPLAVRVLWPLSGAAAGEYLPSPLREKLGLPSTATSRFLIGMLERILPPLLPWLPDRLRHPRQYLAARKRG